MRLDDHGGSPSAQSGREAPTMLILGLLLGAGLKMLQIFGR
jgi:hypothetical protein